jgi:hypothetical protein
MSLSDTEKRALRQKEKLPFGSGQFPLLRQRKSTKQAVGGVFLWIGLLVGGLIALTAVAIWMRG